MKNQNVVEFKDAIFKCMQEFRQEANYKMAQLAFEFDFEIKYPISFPKTVYRHYNNKGTLKGEWSFYFHGSHCRFEHLNTGQVLEVLFTQSPEFGYIDAFFFSVYINTTEKHKWLATIMSQDDIDIAIDLLVQEGLLIKTTNSKYSSLLLAI